MYNLCSGQSQFIHFTFNSDLDFARIETNFLHGTSTCLGKQLCEEFLKSIHKCRSYALVENGTHARTPFLQHSPTSWRKYVR